MPVSPEALELARDVVDPDRDRWWIPREGTGEPPADQPMILLLAEIAARLGRIETLLADDEPTIEPEDELGLPT